jgi:hypothetical protein
VLRWCLALVAAVLGVGTFTPPAGAGTDAVLPATLVATVPGFGTPTDAPVTDLAGVYGGAAAEVVAGHVRTWTRPAGPVTQTVLAVATRLRDEPAARAYVTAFLDAARGAGGLDAPVAGLAGVDRVVWAGTGEQRFDALVLRRGDVVVSLSFTPAGLFDDAGLRAVATSARARLDAAVPGAAAPATVSSERVTEETSLGRVLGTVLPVVVIVGVVAVPLVLVGVRLRRA